MGNNAMVMLDHLKKRNVRNDVLMFEFVWF